MLVFKTALSASTYINDTFLQPCDLKNAKVPGGERYSCIGTCYIQWYTTLFYTHTLGSRALCRDEEHEHHECGAIACPLTCRLCRCLCATADHFHALHADAVHLCG
jgi:predicted secreted protein